MANHKKVQADRMRAEIASIRDKIALCDSQEEIQMYNDQIAEIQEQIRCLNRKAPKVVPVKNAPTVGDRMERRLKEGRKQQSNFAGRRVTL